MSSVCKIIVKYDDSHDDHYDNYDVDVNDYEDDYDVGAVDVVHHIVMRL